MDEKLIKQTFDAGMKRNWVQQRGVGGKVRAGVLAAGGGVFRHPSSLQGKMKRAPPCFSFSEPGRCGTGQRAERPGCAGAGSGWGDGDSGALLAGKLQCSLEFGSEN